MNQTDAQSLFAAIDAGEDARRQIAKRVEQIVVRAQVVNAERKTAVERFANRSNADSPGYGSLWDCLASDGHFHEARFNGSTQLATVVFKDDWRGGPDYYRTKIPYAWLWADDAELTQLMNAEIDAEAAKVDRREKAEEEQAEQERRAQFAILKQEFEPNQSQ